MESMDENAPQERLTTLRSCCPQLGRPRQQSSSRPSPPAASGYGLAASPTGASADLRISPGEDEKKETGMEPPRSPGTRALGGGVAPLRSETLLARGGAARRWHAQRLRSCRGTIPKYLRQPCPPRRPWTRPLAAAIAAVRGPFLPEWSGVPAHRAVRSTREPHRCWNPHGGATVATNDRLPSRTIVRHHYKATTSRANTLFRNF
jgi:hypothetical protein